MITERAALLPGNRKRVLFRKFGSSASTDAAGESRKQGQFFDIVKTGRKGNVDGEVLAVLGNQGNTTRSTVRFLEVHTIHERLRMFGVRCVSSSICRDADAKRANVERYSQISNLRV